MTIEDARYYLTALWSSDHVSLDERIALEMAIKALKQQPCDDAISRQAAINAFERFIHELGIKDEPYNYGEMALSVQNVPSVTPKFTDNEIQKMQELEQAQLEKAYELGKAEVQPCEDCISREEAINEMSNALKRVFVEHRDIAEKTMDKLPSVTPQPKMGRWIVKDNMWWVCSACGCQTRMMKKYNVPRFCPACGAKMVEPQESEDKE